MGAIFKNDDRFSNSAVTIGAGVIDLYNNTYNGIPSTASTAFFTQPNYYLIALRSYLTAIVRMMKAADIRAFRMTASELQHVLDSLVGAVVQPSGHFFAEAFSNPAYFVEMSLISVDDGEEVKVYVDRDPTTMEFTIKLCIVNEVADRVAKTLGEVHGELQKQEAA